MNKAGGIIALIAGIFGVGAAIVTLFIGGVGAALEAEGGEAAVMLGWGGLLFSFLVIIMGAVCISAKGMTSPILLVLFSIGGMALGGGIVMFCMVLALVGGILAVIGVRQQAKAAAGGTA